VVPCDNTTFLLIYDETIFGLKDVSAMVRRHMVTLTGRLWIDFQHGVPITVL